MGRGERPGKGGQVCCGLLSGDEVQSTVSEKRKMEGVIQCEHIYIKNRRPKSPCAYNGIEDFWEETQKINQKNPQNTTRQ